jgi:hypothetical protein
VTRMKRKKKTMTRTSSSSRGRERKWRQLRCQNETENQEYQLPTVGAVEETTENDEDEQEEEDDTADNLVPGGRKDGIRTDTACEDKGEMDWVGVVEPVKEEKLTPLLLTPPLLEMLPLLLLLPSPLLLLPLLYVWSSAVDLPLELLQVICERYIANGRVWGRRGASLPCRSPSALDSTHPSTPPQHSDSHVDTII